MSSYHHTICETISSYPIFPQRGCGGVVHDSLLQFSSFCFLLAVWFYIAPELCFKRECLWYNSWQKPLHIATHQQHILGETKYLVLVHFHREFWSVGCCTWQFWGKEITPGFWLLVWFYPVPDFCSKQEQFWYFPFLTLVFLQKFDIFMTRQFWLWYRAHNVPQHWWNFEAIPWAFWHCVRHV